MTQFSARRSETGVAVGLFSAGIFLFAVNDAIGKWLVTAYPVGQILLVRTLGAALFLVPLLVRYPASRKRPAQLGLHLLRILLMAGDTFAFYDASRSLPLADVMTFYLAAPLFVTALACLLLRERIGPWRTVAVLVGFCGVLVALHPSEAALSPAALVALAGSLMFASALVITRQLRQAHWVTLVALQFVGAGAIGILTSSAAWVAPGWLDLALMLLVGCISMFCFISINKALVLAQASLLAPFQYASIVWAILLGWLVWGDLPTPGMWAGIVLIVASGVMVWMRERIAARVLVTETPVA
jgi:S-adenosylmethionine uptake transporter